MGGSSGQWIIVVLASNCQGLLYGGSSRGPEDEGVAGQVGREERRDPVRKTMTRSCLTGKGREASRGWSAIR